METLPIAGWILGGGLTAVGLIISWVVWRRRGAAAGLRGVAWSLLPLAAGLVGLMSTIWRLGFDIVSFFFGLVFNPVVWAGVVVAGLAVVLWVVSGVMRARGIGTGSGPKAEKAATGAGGGTEVPSGQRPSNQVASAPASKRKSGGGDDFGEIEDLLRKHGIE
ncbi:hypothetical protein [Allosalinactinospora lopnorensis]|uniref:hypothetical protein n=1 Tax=Allosalinactinospora lopnorensis TaxID=1352348 RepID=UPI000623F29A|nr:hypothetical protein [Allosalinactinospora lopnorensis]